MYTRIYIDNYRCFQNFELSPGRITMLLGTNGSGKSSVFDALADVVELVVQGAEIGDVFGSESLTRWDTRTQQRIELDIEGPAGLYKYALVVDHDTESARSLVTEESVHLAGKTLFRYAKGAVYLHKNDGAPGTSFFFRGTRSFLAQVDQRPETKNLMWFRDFLASTWTLRLDARAIGGSSSGEDDTLAHNGANFASWYRHVAQEDPERLNALLTTLRTVVPGLQSLKLHTAGARGVRELSATMSHGGASYEVDFAELSDGQRALIVLYTLLEGTANTTCLLLDEPESHVGIAEVQPFLVALDARHTEVGQAFIISHHPEAIDFLAAGTAFHLSRPPGGPVRVKLAQFDRDSGLAASQQLARGHLDE